MPGIGTREQIMNVRYIIDKCREFNIPVVMCFIDYTKTFECINWKKVVKVLIEIGPPSHMVDLAESLHQFNLCW